MAKWNKGKHWSEAVKEKISKKQKGIPCPQRGKKWTIEQRKRIREANIKTFSLKSKEELSERAKKTHTTESDTKRKRSFQLHKEKILELKEKYEKEGYEVITELDVRPDLIIRKDNKIIAVEVQRGKPKNNYNKQRVFDEVKWEMI